MLLHEDVIEAVQHSAHALMTAANIRELALTVKDKKVVMVGEATHGTAEFYRIRAELSEILIREHGFSFVAVEGDYYPAIALFSNLIL